MVLQYKLKSSSRWKDYPGKDKLKEPVQHTSRVPRNIFFKNVYKGHKFDFRLLSSDKKKVLVEKGSYERVMKRFRQIEFFKHKS